MNEGQSLNVEIFLLLNALRHPVLDVVAQALDILGSNWMICLLAPLLWRGALRTGRCTLQRAAAYTAGTLLGVSLQALLKWLFRVERPAAVLEGVVALVEEAAFSFPSGHATFAFATAYLLGKGAAAQWRLLLFLYALATAWSRVYAGVHYPLDVAAGGALGLLCGWVAWRGTVRFTERRRKGR